MRVVLDTNVLISGLLNPFGLPARVLDLVADGAVIVCYDARIILEYKEVCARPRFGFDSEKSKEFINSIEARGIPCSPKPLGIHISDPDDVPFAEIAVAAGAEYLITGNLKHFPTRFGGVNVVGPKEFIRLVQI